MVSRDDHAGVVSAARAAIAEVQELLALATDRAEVAVGLIDSAVGATPVESGRNAMAYMGGCREKIDEAFNATSVAQQELERYGGGF
jgi:hypothetical protein